METNELGSIGADGSTPIRKILRENKSEEWTEVLEGHGVHCVRDLRRVKYADLVQFGITEFEPRKKIFELIKQLNTQFPQEPGWRASIYQKMQMLSRGSVEHAGAGNVQAPQSTGGKAGAWGEGSPSGLFSERSPDPGEKSALSRAGVFSPIKGAEEHPESDLGLAASHLEGDRSSLQMDNASRLGAGRRISVLKEGYSPGSVWKRKREMIEEIMKEAEDSIIEDDLEMEEQTHLSIADPDTTTEYLSIGSAEGKADLNSWCEPKEEASSLPESGRISVVVRKRPIKKGGKRDTVSIFGPEVVLTESRLKVDLTPYMEPHRYTFDRAYGENNSTEDIYRECVQGLVEYALGGGSSTCIAYGQTGSGKTYTMLHEHTGVIALALRDLLRQRIRISFYEIYSNSIYDLLDDRKKIFAREKDGVVSIVGIKECVVGSLEEASGLIRQGLQCRMTGKTGANSNSSRSHALVRVRTDTGIFTFVDLAGSERGTERGSECQQLLIKREGAEINKSLLALKECIRAMDKSATHLPFRHSKLTQVLKESLVGESKCCIIATISPEEASTEHSLNTLRYAYRIRGLGLKGEGAPPSSRPKSALKAPAGQTRSAPQAAQAYVSGAPPPARSTVPSTPIKEMRAAERQSPARQKGLIQQALASVASRIVRETDPEVLEVMREALLDIAKYQKTR
ncbi:kinesin family member 2/24 [Nematocida major]|uniref:kinesin family member 2/24 n=1 Tax=Nematocida major TaxID=1912982 RepID=UPI0020076731|nr:kinesin family member 2/24 [Nematocida major]KAH9385503.1 kinesin family member 2/24 [Nematocida major]